MYAHCITIFMNIMNQSWYVYVTSAHIRMTPILCDCVKCSPPPHVTSLILEPGHWVTLTWDECAAQYHVVPHHTHTHIYIHIIYHIQNRIDHTTWMLRHDITLHDGAVGWWMCWSVRRQRWRRPHAALRVANWDMLSRVVAKCNSISERVGGLNWSKLGESLDQMTTSYMSNIEELWRFEYALRPWALHQDAEEAVKFGRGREDPTAALAAMRPGLSHDGLAQVCAAELWPFCSSPCTELRPCLRETTGP